MKTGYKIVVVILTGLLINCSKEEYNPPDPIVLELEVTDVSTHGGNDGAIKLNIEGGLSPYNFMWSNGDTTQNIEGLNAGTYIVLVTDKLDSIAVDTGIVNQPPPDTTVTDIDGNIYSIVVIGEQTWMAENLRVTRTADSTAITSYVYNNNPQLAETYGRLYKWDDAMNGSTEEEAQGICPCGWHIPSDEEWRELEMFLGMTEAEANMVNTWRGQNIGTMLKDGGGSGYDALLCGRMTSSGTYQLLNSYEYIWTSSEYSSTYSWRRCLRSNDNKSGRYNTFPKSYAFSVRCIKNKD